MPGNAMKKRGDERLKAALQVPAILCIAVLIGMVIHKAVLDVATLAYQHSGHDFWRELGRYVLRNLGA